mgnify:CR=1 FL=1
MANPLFQEQMNSGFMSQFKTFTQNPMQFLMERKINVPRQFANDPHGAVQYMLNSGQMSQEQLNSLTQIAQRMGVKLP